MKNGDISNVSSSQVIVVSEVVFKLIEEETGRFFNKKTSFILGELEMLATNKLWLLSNNYGLSLEFAGFESDGWTNELLDKAFERLEKRVVNPFNYHQLYENVDELVGLIPYRPNLKGIIDVPGRVARYGSAGIELSNL